MICVDSNKCTFKGNGNSCKDCKIMKGYTFGMFINNIPKVECPSFNEVTQSRLCSTSPDYRTYGINVDNKGVGTMMMVDEGEIENVIGFDSAYNQDELDHVNEYLDVVEKAFSLNLTETRGILRDIYNCKLIKNNFLIKQEMQVVEEVNVEGKPKTHREYKYYTYGIKIKVEKQEDDLYRPNAIIDVKNEYKKTKINAVDCGDTFTFNYGRNGKLNVIETTSDTTIRPIEVVLGTTSIIIDGVFIYKKTTRDITPIAEWKKDGYKKTADFDKAISQNAQLVNCVINIAQKYKDGIAPYWIMEPLKIYK